MRKKDDVKQNAIKRAVVTTVLKEGMHGASISKIAKAAGVSPATVYVYYENKDVMLRDIYYDYTEEIFSHLMKDLSDDIEADLFIDHIIRAYYNLMVQQEEVYHFVEQFSSCPSLKQACTKKTSGPHDLDERITKYKAQGAMINYDNSNIWAMILFPVKGVATNICAIECNNEKRLDEMIHIIQRALLK